MKKLALLSVIVALGFFLFVPGLHALDITGWWKLTMNLDQGDFQTGQWRSWRSAGKGVSYLYVSSTDLPDGWAVLLLWDEASSDYIREPSEGYYGGYIFNNIIVFSLGQFSLDGVPVVGGTMTFRPIGSSVRPYMMRGVYSVYDRETEGTPDQFVRMGTMSATRIAPEYVPELAIEKITPP